MTTYQITASGRLFEIKRDSDGKFFLPDEVRELLSSGTALKPSWEPICLARKPLIGTVAENVLAHGTGALNIDGCRIGTETITQHGRSNSENTSMAGRNYAEPAGREWQGRWPANIVHDGSDEVLAAFPVTAPAKAGARGEQHSGRHGGIADIGGNIKEGTNSVRGHNDNGGSAARFFYCAKASRKDRDEGLEGFEKKVVNVTEGHGRGAINTSKAGDGVRENRPRANTHPTVKPTDLMRWLCRLVTPPGGVILDPFMGSGSTGKAALLEGFRFIGCEREDEYMPIAEARIAAALRRTANDNRRPAVAHAQPAANDNQPDLFGAAA